MSVDWITIAAQIVNFLVLVWLLKRFLYRPILDGIDAREREIAEGMAKAGAAEAAAAAVEASYRAKAAALRAGQDSALAEARATASAERDRLLAEARAEQAAEAASRAQRRADEARAYHDGLQQSGARALLALTRKALTDLAGTTLEAQMVRQALARLHEMAPDLQAIARDETRRSGKVMAEVTTATPLPEAETAQITRELTKILPDTALTFKTDPARGPGLSFACGGTQIDWTLESYMQGLEALLDPANAPQGPGVMAPAGAAPASTAPGGAAPTRSPAPDPAASGPSDAASPGPVAAVAPRPGADPATAPSDTAEASDAS
ncbi:F0F1 ATP synthase subunit delta [Phaeovulum sp. W22_SRMD_FR3]|uniref:F0F1 ATP synthase subunit delta n=1 Tax=Phaeovulum sp. W22_SRMD_FR3 TaxID=3240274 RepID=UPI003F9583A4